MRKAALLISILSLLTLQSFAQSSTPSATPADLGCDEGIVKACRAAAGELVAARKLIDAQRAELAALNDRLEIEKTKNGIIEVKVKIQADQVAALGEALKARGETIAVFEQLVSEQRERIATLERDLQTKLAKARKRALYSALAAMVAGFILGR